MENPLFKRPFGLICVLALLAIGWALLPPAHAAQPSDEFIRGYASAVVAMNYPAGVESIRVDDGVVYLDGVTLSEKEQTELHKMLSDVEGVIRVEFVTEIKRTDTTDVHLKEKKQASEPDDQLPVFLPTTPLFQSLLADPRWPHFSASLQRYIDDEQLRNVASTNFGESFGIYRSRGPWESTMELGIQAGVFAIFDIDSESFDLINADYFVGIPFTIKKGNFANLTRIFHQSSHLGDEFLLRGRTDERINLSYEGVNNLFSYHLPAGFRLYAGGGYIFHREPSGLDPWSTQAGLGFRSPRLWLKRSLRPVAGIDVQNRQESDWATDVSARAGIQFENPDFLSRKLQLLFEYYNGKSPNGQFYENNIEFFGLGLHFFFD
ncbi:MAG: DUF1207 domain-containing protein [Desulfobacteraceae bacterium]|jgi:hypothetical protein|nr:DUF1207 domain-containing protein [Desulfobacteraceae bacterium]